MYKLVLCSVLALAPFAAMATISSSGGTFSPEKGLDVASQFEAQRTAILAALNDGKTYSELSQADRSKVVGSLDRISGLLGEHTSPDQLPELIRLEIFNEQEQVNTLLSRSHNDSRMVCSREKPIGSHRQVNRCMTVAERRRAQEQSQQMLNKAQTTRSISNASP